jgi:hypothetical protein
MIKAATIKPIINNKYKRLGIAKTDSKIQAIKAEIIKLRFVNNAFVVNTPTVFAIKVVDIPKTTQIRQYKSWGNLPTKNKCKLTWITSHCALVINQITNP